MNAPTAPYIKTMVECHAKMVKDGYTENFALEEGQLKALSTGNQYKPEDVKIINFFRFEGQNDPDDDSIMYVIETTDHTRGTIVDGYGPSSDANITAFILEVENIQKKLPTA